VDAEVVDKIAAQIEAQLTTQKIEDEKDVNSFCLNYLRECLDVIQPIRINPKKKGNLFFLVGPTGVGKTTTIAKLAANMAFVNRKKVALITIDTFRVAAVEQLRTFAEIMDIPIGVGFNPSDLLTEIERLSGSDVIFVDTAGRSPYNKEHMEELRQCVLLARPKEVILVLSATTSRVDLINNYKAFSDIGIDKIIFTKLDETVAWGQILNTVYEMKKPIAYITNGQNVPDDITVPDPAKLAAKLLLKEY
jgi:flagellar biosynthesis protein FlhF